MYYSFHCELPHCTFHVSLSFLLIFFIDTVHSSDSSFYRKRSIKSQLNVQAATAENREQYTLSNIMYIAFQNSYSVL